MQETNCCSLVCAKSQFCKLQGTKFVQCFCRELLDVVRHKKTSASLHSKMLVGRTSFAKAHVGHLVLQLLHLFPAELKPHLLGYGAVNSEAAAQGPPGAISNSNGTQDVQHCALSHACIGHRKLC